MPIESRHPEEHNIPLLAPMGVPQRFVVLPDGRRSHSSWAMAARTGRVPIDLTLRIAGLTPNARAVILNRCGHWAQLEHAAEFNRLVLGFLEK